MSTMSMPGSLKDLVNEQVSQPGYGTSRESVRELIRRDQDRLQRRNLLLARASSAPTEPVTKTDFERLRERVRGAAKMAGKTRPQP
jgi:antitoxin ParD1/3/4